MAVFPLTYAYTKDNPIYYPYTGTPPNKWNYQEFNISFWHHLEWCLDQIFQIGNGKFMADVIIFHPYDHGKWGFDCMGCSQSNYSTCSQDPQNYDITNDLFYLKYVQIHISS